MKSIYSIITFGCKVNQYESQIIKEQFELNKDFTVARDKEKADVFVINSCVVTEKSEQKVKYVLRKLRKNNPLSVIVLTGCIVSGINKENFFSEADYIIANDDKDEIVDILRPGKEKSLINGISGFGSYVRVFLKIQDGCDSFCSYCIIPYVRNKFKSKSFKDVCVEIDSVAKNGCKEIVFTGIHLGKYGKNSDEKLLDVFSYVEQKQEIKRVRLSSFEPMEIDNTIIEFLKNSSKFCPHMHIPLQSGDDYILKRMNRNYISSEYLDVVNNLKSKIENISISTDIIVGFPGETEEHFENTRDLVKKAGFSRTHIFTYSDRKQTKAYCFENKIPEKIKKIRYNILKQDADKSAMDYKKGFVGQKIPVLIERVDGKFGYGYSDRYLPVRVRGKDLNVNEIVTVSVEGVEGQSLKAIKN
ncbi:tRNA (N(6)-L-threonylcarbamoyladenosine(37)-C(2))-methylthiotransferase MtaB [bacterium]|nr:tRNA (N(6)-L-threonylcarbamoyladenosine(37)-C(2))-methylthiotransferase MtaB [bacterium]